MQKFLIIALVFFIFSACQSDKPENADSDTLQQTQSQDNSEGNTSAPEFDVQMPDQPAAPQQQEGPQQVNIPAGADGIVHHYICVDQCEGGHAEGPGNCPVCNKTLAHNQAWHDAQNQNQSQNQPGQTQPQPNQFGPRTDADPAAPQQSPNPPQQPQQVNIPAGDDGIVHHYVCADGCKGGHAENPGTCPVCNKTLAHNQAFHNQ